MCGIAGYLTFRGSTAVEEATKKMVAALRRRGPDGEGFRAWPGAAFGHRRLAILDLSDAAQQPMLTPSGDIGIVFNGCIYNFLQLRDELASRGHEFRSQCDTEVLLHGYQEWGIDNLVKRLRGMFAFAIWDHPQRKLTLVRDRLGVKPLLYGVKNGDFAFASTLRALEAADFAGEVDPQAVLEFLEYGFVSDERCILSGVQKLPPATILEWQDGRATERIYWTAPAPGAQPVNFEDAVEETERLLLDAVRSRLVSDVPIGVLLSGGIDSALVCWALAALNANVTAFTVGAHGDPSDESAAARETARRLGIDHKIVLLPENQAPLLDDMIAAYSEPFASQSAQGVLLVSQAVKQSATVLLTGDGADDVFLGYPFFRNAWMAHRIAQWTPGAAVGIWAQLREFLPQTGVLRRFKSFADYVTGGIGAHARARNGLPYLKAANIMGERLDNIRLAQREVVGSLEAGRRLFYDLLQYHRKLHFTSEFMQKVDGGTMHYGIEARSPFLDHRLWDFAASMPPQVHLRHGSLKAVLRKIAQRRLGQTVASRPKQGFTIPVEQLLTKNWFSALSPLERPQLLEDEGWIRRGSLKPITAEIRRKGWVPTQLWYLLILELWLRRRRNRAAEPVCQYR